MPRSGAALALVRLGLRQHACQLAEAELADVRVFGAPRALGVALRAAGLARGEREGLALLGESVAALDGSSALLERAHSLAELGAALRRDGQRAAAPRPAGPGARPRRPLWRPAAGRPGPRGAQGRRRPPAAPAATGVEALTPSELRVARLAAEGRTNREIACELYVTLKAIEGHLARAYAKLGIGSRRQLARALAAGKD